MGVSSIVPQVICAVPGHPTCPYPSRVCKMEDRMNEQDRFEGTASDSDLLIVRVRVRAFSLCLRGAFLVPRVEPLHFEFAGPSVARLCRHARNKHVCCRAATRKSSTLHQNRRDYELLFSTSRHTE